MESAPTSLKKTCALRALLLKLLPHQHHLFDDDFRAVGQIWTCWLPVKNLETRAQPSLSLFTTHTLFNDDCTFSFPYPQAGPSDSTIQDGCRLELYSYGLRMPTRGIRYDMAWSQAKDGSSVFPRISFESCTCTAFGAL